MSGIGRSQMMRRYEEMTEAEGPTLFLASEFQVRPENIHTSEYVEIDILRGNNDVAVVVSDIAADGQEISSTKLTNKQWTPPIFKQKFSVNAFDLNKRIPGNTPYESPSYRAAVVDQVQRTSVKGQDMYRRSLEMMASQVTQKGALLLPGAIAGTWYSLDFKMKNSHIVTVGNDWNGGSSTKLADIESLAEVTVRDGKRTPDKLKFGRLAWQDFLADTDVQALLDNRRINRGNIDRPRRDRNGGIFHGELSIGSYEFELWTYPGWYTDPITQAQTPFITEDNVIMTSSMARYDLSFGDIPTIPGAPQQALDYVPRRFTVREGGMDVIVRAWFANDGTSLHVSQGMRPLTIPTAIDTISVLNTRA